jgi:hypothetical protein
MVLPGLNYLMSLGSSVRALKISINYPDRSDRKLIAYYDGWVVIKGQL